MAVGPILLGVLGLAVLLGLAGKGGSATYAASGPYAGIPARKLTQAQALAVLHDLDASGVIHVTRWPSSLNLSLDMDPRVGDVSFLYLGKNAQPIVQVDPRFAVFLARLARMLRSNFGVTTIEHLGIYPGNDATPDDVHNHGRAIDLSGVDGPFGNLSVKKDWGDKPTPYDLKTATVTSYRLRPSDRGAALFAAIYGFATQEAADRTAGPDQSGPPTHIGDHSYILHPDHPDPTYRPKHQDHFHLQVGNTLGKDPLGT